MLARSITHAVHELFVGTERVQQGDFSHRIKIESRDQLACSARRLPAEDDLAIVRNLLLRDEDAGDNRLPLLLWWAIESKAGSDRAQVTGLFHEAALWSHPIVRLHILERIMRRYALAGSRADLMSCAELFDLAPSQEFSQTLMAGFETAFQGRTMSGFPPELLSAMARFDGESVAAGLREGKPRALETALKSIADEKTKMSVRLQFIGILGEIEAPGSVPILLQLLQSSQDTTLNKAALAALERYNDPRIGAQIIAIYPTLDSGAKTAAGTLLASRAGWARQWLQAIVDGKVPADSLSQNTLRTIRSHQDEELARLSEKVWGKHGHATTADMDKKIRRLVDVARAGRGDPYEGRTLFQATCAVCHTLFGQGGKVGPDLTVYQRDDLPNMLLSIVNPSAEIREGYENYLLETKDDRSLNGFLVESNDQVVVLRGLDGQNTTLDRKDLLKLAATGVSLMPEGLLDNLNDQQVRNLLAYLRCTQPLIGKSTGL